MINRRRLIATAQQVIRIDSQNPANSPTHHKPHVVAAKCRAELAPCVRHLSRRPRIERGRRAARPRQA